VCLRGWSSRLSTKSYRGGNPEFEGGDSP
jgi:hypothetical protein